MYQKVIIVYANFCVLANIKNFECSYVLLKGLISAQKGRICADTSFLH